MDQLIWIDGNVPSSKNSRQNGFPSKHVRKYLQEIGVKKYSCTKNKKREIPVPHVIDYDNRLNKFKEAFQEVKFKPYDGFVWVGMHFVRSTSREFDFNNISQIIMDLMVAHGYLAEDSLKYACPLPLNIKGEYYSVNKEKPGVLLFFTEDPHKCFYKHIIGYIK